MSATMTATPDDLAPAALREINDLHAFFTLWFGGRIEKTEAHFARFRDALDAGFGQANPAGAYRERAHIVSDVWDHWNWFPGDPSFRIWIEAARIVHRIGADHVLAVYQEWSLHKGETIGRTCTALLARRPGTPGGVAWLQMHESRMPPGTRPG
jgi:hypothetical protein